MNHANRFMPRLLAGLTLAASIALPLAAMGVWLFWDQLAPASNDPALPYYDPAALGAGARLAGFALFLTGALTQAYGLLGLRQTFLEAAAGRALSLLSVYGFRRFAWVSLFMAAFAIVQRTGLIALLSASDPTKQNALSIQIGTPELKAIFMGLLLVFVAQVFAQAKAAKDENDAFV
ncbi:hypothetical protein [Hyphococcus sp.]|jgi:hypothetical protein|uniref:hypothetical protein n=1 Tax=Hyphococcus sp. TaxID=2038636 RepID=UPI003D1035B2